MDDLQRDVLAHLHANPALSIEQLASTAGRGVDDVRAAVEGLVEIGSLERDEGRLVPTGETHAEPGLFVANERDDAAAVETEHPSPPDHDR